MLTLDTTDEIEKGLDQTKNKSNEYREALPCSKQALGTLRLRATTIA